MRKKKKEEKRVAGMTVEKQESSRNEKSVVSETRTDMIQKMAEQICNKNDEALRRLSKN